MQALVGSVLLDKVCALIPIPDIIIKIPVDVVLFVFSYMIQRDYVFNK